MKKYLVLILINCLVVSLTAQYAFAFFAVPVRDSYSRKTLTNIFTTLDTISSNLARDLPAINTNIARVLQSLMENQTSEPISDIGKMDLYFNSVQDASAFLNSLEENTPRYQQEIFDEGQKVGLIKALNRLSDILKCIPAGRRDDFKREIMNDLSNYDLALKGEEVIDSISDCEPSDIGLQIAHQIKIPYSLSLLSPFNMAYFLGNVHMPGTNPFNFQQFSIVIENKSKETFDDINYRNLLATTREYLKNIMNLEVFMRFQGMSRIMPAFERCKSGYLTDSGQPLCSSRITLMGGEEFASILNNLKTNFGLWLANAKTQQAQEIVIKNMANVFLPYNFSNITYNQSSPSQNNQQNNSQQNNQSQSNEDNEERLTNINPESIQELYDSITTDNQQEANPQSGNNSTGNSLSGGITTLTDFVNDVLDNSIVLNGIKFGDLKNKFCDKVSKDNKPVSGLIGNVSCIGSVVSGLKDVYQLKIVDLERKRASLDRFNQFLISERSRLDELERQLDRANCEGAAAYINQQKNKIDEFQQRANNAKIRIVASINAWQGVLGDVNRFIVKANNFVYTFNRFTVSLQEGINEVLNSLKIQQIIAIVTSLFEIPILSDLMGVLDVLSQVVNIILSVINAPSTIQNAISRILGDFNDLLDQFGVQIDEIREINRELILIDREYLSQVNILSTIHRHGIGIRILEAANRAQTSGGGAVGFQCRIAKKMAQLNNSQAMLRLKNKKNYITYYSPQSQQNKGIFNALIANILSIKNIFEPKILTINLQ